MQNYTSPLDWKSELWWRKRPLDERLFHMHLPPRIEAIVDDNTDIEMPVGNLLLQGPAGSGKSVIAAVYLRNLVASGASGRWIEADDYIDMIKESFDNDGLLPEMYSVPHLVKYVKGVYDVVVIDGLGEERRTDFAVHELGSLIRKRFDRSKTTIITSSLSLADIRNRYGERLGSVMKDFAVETISVPQKGLEVRGRR